jgi:hypothetical protein
MTTEGIDAQVYLGIPLINEKKGISTTLDKWTVLIEFPTSIKLNELVLLARQDAQLELYGVTY